MQRQFPPRLLRMRTRVELLLFIRLWITQNNLWIIFKWYKQVYKLTSWQVNQLLDSLRDRRKNITCSHGVKTWKAVRSASVNLPIRLSNILFLTKDNSFSHGGCVLSLIEDNSFLTEGTYFLSQKSTNEQNTQRPIKIEAPPPSPAGPSPVPSPKGRGVITEIPLWLIINT